VFAYHLLAVRGRATSISRLVYAAVSERIGLAVWEYSAEVRGTPPLARGVEDSSKVRTRMQGMAVREEVYAPSARSQHISGATWRAMEVSEQHLAVEGLTGEENCVVFPREGAHTHPTPGQNGNPCRTPL